MFIRSVLVSAALIVPAWAVQAACPKYDAPYTVASVDGKQVMKKYVGHGLGVADYTTKAGDCARMGIDGVVAGVIHWRSADDDLFVAVGFDGTIVEAHISGTQIRRN